MDGPCVTDEYATETMHEPFLNDSVSMHDQMRDRVSPMSTDNLKSKCASPTTVHGDHTSY